MEKSEAFGDKTFSRNADSREILEGFFHASLQELYFAEHAIDKAYAKVKRRVISPELRKILTSHHQIQQNHRERLNKIFLMTNFPVELRSCESALAILSQANKHLQIFYADQSNWEIALILISQKLAHYKIASYGALAHLAINLNNYRAATLLAISVQEEEDYICNHLNSVLHDIMRPFM